MKAEEQCEKPCLENLHHEIEAGYYDRVYRRGPAMPASALRADLEGQHLPLLIVLGITLLAKGGALLPGYSIDDYQPASGIAGLLGCALLWSVGGLLFRQPYWPVPRTMAHVGIFWAGCLVIAAGTAPRPWITRSLGVAAVVVLLSFIGVSQHIFDDQWRLNRRDQHKADRIVLRLEALPGFEGLRKVAFVGRSGWYPIGMPRTQWGDMNTSAFGPFWSQVSLLREVSGYDTGWFIEPQERAAADGYCAQAEPWPAPGSVAIRGNLGIVCLAKAGTP